MVSSRATRRREEAAGWLARGYLFAKPMPGEELRAMLARGESYASRLQRVAAG